MPVIETSKRMGSVHAKAYLASPEVVAASALSGKISGSGQYQAPHDWKGVEFGEGDGIEELDRLLAIDETLEDIISQLDGIMANADEEFIREANTSTRPDKVQPVHIRQGFPEKITGEILFCDSDNINTDGIYPGRLTYQDHISTKQMAEACMQNYDPAFSSIAKDGDILVSGYSFGCGSSREQAATAILAKKISLVVAGSFSNIFARNSINNALVTLEIPKLVERLRASFPASSMHQKEEITEASYDKELLSSSPSALPREKAEVLTRRTGWHLTWDVRRSKVEIDEGHDKPKWSLDVVELPANVQDIIAKGVSKSG